jgi:hypothetical protein
VKQDQTRQLSILACVTGLVLIAMFFGATALHATAPDWLPMMISAIAGFEMFMFGQSIWLKRAGR